MPHDQNGNLLNNGDVVTLKAVISNLSEGEKMCNCTYTVIIPDGIDETYAPSFSANTRLSSKVIDNTDTDNTRANLHVQPPAQPDSPPEQDTPAGGNTVG